MISLLITAAPVILKLIGFFFKDREDRARARVRFLNYIEKHKHYTKKPVEMHKRYNALKKLAMDDLVLARKEKKESLENEAQNKQAE